MTQYKVGKKAGDTSAYADSVYKIDEAGTRTKEGDQWVQIYAYEGNAGTNGWVLYSQLKAADSSNSGNNGNNSQPTTDKIGDNVLRINFVDAATGMPVKSMDYVKNGGTKGSTLGTLTNGVWQLGASDQTAIQTQMNTTLNALGYYPGALTTDQMASLAQGTLGSSVTISIQKGNKPIVDKAVRIQLTDPNGNLIKNVDYTNATAANGKTLGTANGSSWTLAAADVTAIQDQIVKALKGTGYGLNDDNKLTTAQQTALAQTVFGGQVKIQTVIPKAPEIGDNQVKLTFVDTDGKTINSIKLTKADGESTVQDTIKTAANGKDPANDTQAFTELVKTAGITKYGITNLNSTQLSANTAALQAASYGKEVKLTLAKEEQKSLIANVNFLDKVDTSKPLSDAEIENGNGKRATSTDFSKALAGDANVIAPVGSTVTTFDFNKALATQGLDVIYYAATDDGWLGAAKTRLKAADLDGTSGGVFSTGMKDKSIYLYKLTISAAPSDTSVSGPNGALFDKNGNAIIGSDAKNISLTYTQSKAPSKVKLSDNSAVFQAKSLKEAYENALK